MIGDSILGTVKAVSIVQRNNKSNGDEDHRKPYH